MQKFRKSSSACIRSNKAPASFPAHTLFRSAAGFIPKPRVRIEQTRCRVACWGYSTNIAAYELMNEVDGMDGYDVANTYYRQTIAAWHTNMINYIKNTLNDNKHLVTTSYCSEKPDGAHFPIDQTNSVFANTLTDIVSMHQYYFTDAGSIVNNAWKANFYERADDCNFITEPSLSMYAKPYIIGKLGIEAMSGYWDVCADVEFHNSLWSSAFMGGYGAGLYWHEFHKDSYRDNFIALKSFMSGIDFEGNNLIIALILLKNGVLLGMHGIFFRLLL